MRLAVAVAAVGGGAAHEGKTTIARKMGQILHMFDVLATPNVVVTSGNDMCGQVRHQCWPKLLHTVTWFAHALRVSMAWPWCQLSTRRRVLSATDVSVFRVVLCISMSGKRKQRFANSWTTHAAVCCSSMKPMTLEGLVSGARL